MLSVIAINTAPAPPNPSSTVSNQAGNYHIIPVKNISSFQVQSLDSSSAEQSFSNVAPPVASLDIKRLREREEAKIRQLREQQRKKGKGVTREAQAVYDALDRMYVVPPKQYADEHSTNQVRYRFPTRWHEQEIVVNDAVIISPPYTVDDCKAPKGKESSLVMIRKVLDGERRKIAQRAAAAAAQGGTPPPGAPRKGG